MKTSTEVIDRVEESVDTTQNPHIEEVTSLASPPVVISRRASRGGGRISIYLKASTLVPFFFLFAMFCALFLLDAILPLRDLWFHEAQLTQLGAWPVLPSFLLFPGWTIMPPIHQTHVSGTPPVLPGWGMVLMLLGALVVVFVVYFQALRYLPARVSRRYLLYSTLFLGLLYALIPVVTSPDLYSYIAYARIGAIHGLNPVTTIPEAIHTDVVYPYVVWVDQPSAYGPTWAIVTCVMQWLLALFGMGAYVLPMVIALRLFGLLTHFLSTLLIWSISGSFQRLNGFVSYEKRLFATLAFAWNPLLLFEACTNAHNDAALLLLLLLAIWFLVRRKLPPEPGLARPTRLALLRRYLPPFVKTALASISRFCAPITCRLARLWRRMAPTCLYLAPAALFALASCLKINLVLLVPGLLFYLWQQETKHVRLRRVAISTATYLGLIVLLYAPFWQNGAIFNVLTVNPTTSRTINSLADFTGHLYNSIIGAMGFTPGAPIGSPSEHFMHNLTMGLFALLYCLFAWQVLRVPRQLQTLPALVRWMAIIWLLYCALGSPWFWPWYSVTFFGLYALLEAARPGRIRIKEVAGANKLSSLALHEAAPSAEIFGARVCYRLSALLLHPTTVRALAFSMLSLYCFIAWGPAHSFVPGLPDFSWAYFGDLWAWLLPLFALRLNGRFNIGWFRLLISTWVVRSR